MLAEGISVSYGALDASDEIQHSRQMQTPSFAKTPPFVEIIEIGDPVSANAGVDLIAQDVVQLQTAPLKARQVIVRLEGAIVMYHSTNLRVRSRPALHKHLMGYVTFGPSTTGTVDGLPIRQDSLFIVPPGAEVGFVTDSGYESFGFLMGTDELHAHLSLRGRLSEFHVPHRSEALNVGTERSGKLFAWGLDLIDTAVHQPEIFNLHKEQRASAHADLMEILLTTLAGARKAEPGRSERTGQMQSTIVQAAEQFALAHVTDRLYVSDLCKATGVSERALEYAFRAVMGLSPVAYLSRLRLHRVHETLLAATSGTTTVTIEALKWGFWHFGEFSKAYKDCFGELPSDTLRRPGL